ncbi:LuxR family transcriptional regulator [Labedella phragmitis]|uniref:LuxR family transcriptional regulator n=1 Tax=Labedella phragmitis TaxID=2498849 RepID=A0A3S3Z9W4_9MICO|nr:LuxR family transcriptional regulator [Labedella phragmitis]RWZ50930.1 LuxR family transcriptional regulator [Labedella phragmitis]
MSIETDLRAAVAAEEWERVHEIIGANWSDLTNHHRGTLVAAMSSLPPDLRASMPRYAASKAYGEFIPVGGQTRSSRFTSPEAAPRALIDYLSILTARSAAARMRGRHALAVSAAREAREMLDDATPAARAEIASVLADLKVQWGIALLLAGDLERALGEFSAAYDSAIAAENRRMAVESAGDCALVLALQGLAPAASGWIARIPEVDDPTDTVADSGHIATALVAIDAGDRDRAALAISRFRSSSDEVDHWAIRRFAVSRFTTTFGSDPVAALSALAATRAEYPERERTTGINGALLVLAEAELRLLTGDLDAAEAVLELNRRTVVPAFANAFTVMTARVAASSGHRDRARRLAGAVIANDPLPRDGAAALLLSASLDPSAAEAPTLASALRLMTEFGLTTVATTVPLDVWTSLSSQKASPIDVPLAVVFGARHPASTPTLSRREAIVLRAASAGMTVPEIAAAERVSPHTAKKQLLSAYHKLGVSNRADAITALAASPWILAAAPHVDEAVG